MGLSDSISLAGYWLQALLAFLVSWLFFVLYRRYPRGYLKLWGQSWVVLGLYAGVGALTAYAAIREFPLAIIIALSLLSVLAAYWHPALLLFGTFEIATGRELQVSVRRRILWVVSTAAILVSSMAVWMPIDVTLLLTIGLNGLLAGIAFVYAWFSIKSTHGWKVRVGARTMGWAFLFGGASQLHYFAVRLVFLFGVQVSSYYLFFRLADLLVSVLLGMGMVLWLMEEERDRGLVLESQLLESQKQSAVGTLAGNIAHDFNNVLMVIDGYVSLAREIPDMSDSLRRYIDEIDRAGQRAVALTGRLLSFGRRRPTEEKVVHLHEVVTGMRGMLDLVLRRGVELRVLSNGRPAAVRADLNQLEQLILNLAINACDAMPDGGRIEVETGSVTLHETLNGAGELIGPGSYCFIRVGDSGIGIEEDQLQRIFEPLFTTKGDSGTGLGLSTVLQIARSHSGDVVVQSTLLRGTDFKVYLPVVDD